MLYSSSFDALKKCLVGVQKYIQVNIIIFPASHVFHVFILTQATDESEASEEEIEQQLRKTDRIWEMIFVDISSTNYFYSGDIVH